MDLSGPQSIATNQGWWAVKIVALGDSLTVGETGFISSPEEPATPYPEGLQSLAEDYLRNRRSPLSVIVLNRGINGDLTSGMIERFPNDVVSEKPDHVIILGGSNDIGWGLDPATIAHNLTNIYDAALGKGIRAVACSVPSILGFDELIPPRLELNRIIMAEATRRKMPFMDLFMETAHPQSKRLLENYSADGLHLNAKGYRRVAEYIFDKWLKDILNNNVG